jgi:secondary thiamine-phosphate synthase enzyme
MINFFQNTLKLPSFPAGYHLITDEIEAAIPENADPTVRKDFQTFVNELIPESYPRFVHTYEGSDDMPAHIKASFFDSNLQIPITQGKLNLGIWQGIYLCEFRRAASGRSIILTAYGI